MKAFLAYALEEERRAIRFYGGFMEVIQGRDIVTYDMLLEILKVHIAVEDEIENFRK